MSKPSWKGLVIAGIMVVALPACGTTARETSPPEPTRTPLPITSTANPPTSTPMPTSTTHPATRTPFPESCDPADSSILEMIQAFEALVNEKNLEGTMALFAGNAILEESFQGVVYEGLEEIESLWVDYYQVSPPCEFRDIAICGNTATFVWAELQSLTALLWPVVVEIHDGKITYWDFYENSTLGSLEGE